MLFRLRGRFASHRSSVWLGLCPAQACVFYAVSASAGDELNTWISAQGLLRESTYSKYVAALYWSMSTMTTVGYGDVAAVSDMERLLSACPGRLISLLD